MKKKETDVLSKEFIEACGLNAEEVAEIEGALALADTAEMLPENEDKIYNKIEKVIPDDIDKGIEFIGELSNKDPKFFAQLVALTEINDSVREEPPAEIKKLSADERLDTEVKEIIENL